MYEQLVTCKYNQLYSTLPVLLYVTCFITHQILQDNCREVYQTDQKDTERDGVGNACDNCPDAYNPDQSNNDGDSNGDACDPDDDNDGRRKLKRLYELYERMSHDIAKLQYHISMLH